MKLAAQIDKLLASPRSEERDQQLTAIAVELFQQINPDKDRNEIAKISVALKAGAEGGIASAWIDYGRCLWNGWGVSQDRDEALACYKRAGESGSDYGAYLAAYNLYWHFKRYEDAFSWAGRAMELGDDPDGSIAYLLGLMAFNGRGCQKDVRLASKYHTQAAEAGNADAQFEMGIFQLQGLAGETKVAEALDYLHQAAAQEHPRALLNLGAFHATGQFGVEMDFAASFQFYVRAVSAGNGAAAGRLAVMCLNGQGTPKDEAQARAWVERADELGFDVDALLEANKLKRPSGGIAKTVQAWAANFFSRRSA